MSELRNKFAVRLIKDKSATPEPQEVHSAVEGKECRPNWTHVRCFIAPAGEIKVQTRYISEQHYWSVDGNYSELIEFSGCDYNGGRLVIGRFYFHTEFLLGNTIWPKEKTFLKWADQIFRAAKKSLTYSKASDVYVGADAAKWKENGGVFLNGPWELYRGQPSPEED
jgi:hypothetical protein